MNRVLIVALHFPPWSASSGHLRILSFCRELPAHGWEAAVLTAHPRAHAASQRPLRDEPLDGLPVYRAFALDTREHLSIAGKYPSWLALPDRWSSWWIGGVWRGLRVIRQWKPRVIFSTYPVVTAHLIGLTLSRLSGIPWIADFRDPIIDGRLNDETLERRVRHWVERKTMENCTRAVFTTEGARGDYARRYPLVTADKLVTIANGFDEGSFREAEGTLERNGQSARAPLRVVHSGALYPDLRDPGPLFRALAELKREQQLDARRLQIVFRASDNEDHYRNQVAAEQIEDLIAFEPGISYHAALQEMLGADGLLVLQGDAANYQIPAKIYEYLRAGRPILALVDSAGDTAALLERAGASFVAQIDDVSAIKKTISSFLSALESSSWIPPDVDFVSACSRAARAAELARLLDSMG